MHARLDDIARNLSGALIALDFDGTLAPIVDDPRQARPIPGIVNTLTGLAERGAQIAIITGRDALTVLKLGEFHSIPGLIVSGLYNAETWHDEHLTTLEEPAGLAALRAALPPRLAEVDPGLWLEDKRLSLVVHARQAADPDEALASIAPVVTALAESHGLQIHPGKMVLEIRIPGLSKADALTTLLTDTTSAAFFAGDDLGDIPAVHSIRSWAARTGRPALTLAVGEVAELRAVADETAASPHQLAELLAGLAAPRA
jgi:trehalose 6-phosphate phosphatase